MTPVYILGVGFAAGSSQTLTVDRYLQHTSTLFFSLVFGLFSVGCTLTLSEDHLPNAYFHVRVADPGLLFAAWLNPVGVLESGRGGKCLDVRSGRLGRGFMT